MKNTYIIRADASPSIGAGHVMRMIALGQMLLDSGHKVHFVTTTKVHEILNRIKQEKFELHRLIDKDEWNCSLDAEETISIAEDMRADWVVLDGHGFKTDYQIMVKEKGLKLMYLSDFPCCHIVADVVLNQNVNADCYKYSSEPYTKFYLGSKHVLLRREFIMAKSGFDRFVSKEVRKILVTMGASNYNDITRKVLEVLEEVEGSRFHIKAVAGPLSSQYSDMLQYAKSSKNKIEVFSHVSSEMPELMKWADVGVFAGGSTVFEGQYLRLPLICCQLVDDQEPNYAPSLVYNEALYGQILSKLRSLANFYIMENVHVSPFDIKAIS